MSHLLVRESFFALSFFSFLSFSFRPPSALYIHTCIHTYIHTFIHTFIHTYIHTYILIQYMVYPHFPPMSASVVEEHVVTLSWIAVTSPLLMHLVSFHRFHLVLTPKPLMTSNFHASIWRLMWLNGVNLSPLEVFP